MAADWRPAAPPQTPPNAIPSTNQLKPPGWTTNSTTNLRPVGIATSSPAPPEPTRQMAPLPSISSWTVPPSVTPFPPREDHPYGAQQSISPIPRNPSAEGYQELKRRRIEPEYGRFHFPNFPSGVSSVCSAERTRDIAQSTPATYSSLPLVRIELTGSSSRRGFNEDRTIIFARVRPLLADSLAVGGPGPRSHDAAKT
jgi:hypothetical protein